MNLWAQILILLLISCVSRRPPLPHRGLASAPSVRLSDIKCEEDGSFLKWKVSNPSIRYAFELVDKGYDVQLPWDIPSKNMGKVQSCLNDFSTYLIGANEKKISFKFLNSSKENLVYLKMEEVKCPEIVSVALWQLGVVDSLADGLEFYERINTLPRYLLVTCSCNGLDQGAMTYGGCKASLEKAEEKCPVTAHVSERTYSWKDYKEFDQFKNHHCDRIWKRFPSSTEEEKNSRKFICKEVKRKQSILGPGDFEKIIPEKCPGLKD